LPLLKFQPSYIACPFVLKIFSFTDIKAHCFHLVFI